ncbi:MAG: hypothetical protein ABL308_12775 [Oceanicaulis sp.]
MPISKIKAALYPGGSLNSPEWRALRALILGRAGHACEGSPAYPECRAVNGAPHPVTGSKVVLTIAHLDHDPANSHPSNLRAWCQRCHNTYDAPHRRDPAPPDPGREPRHVLDVLAEAAVAGGAYPLTMMETRT